MPTTIALPTSPFTGVLVRVIELLVITIGVPAAPTVVLFVLAGLLPWILMAVPLTQLLKVLPETVPVLRFELLELIASSKTWTASPEGIVRAAVKELFWMTRLLIVPEKVSMPSPCVAGLVIVLLVNVTAPLTVFSPFRTLSRKFIALSWPPDTFCPTLLIVP